ncbi:MAG TPA: DUF1015 domain-containing protein [Planctomycetaceae bacterium]|nr:DUF1015 domain-containing protein [Planctomycetaceae bacterium]HIQ19663.1 DUF1015 domain-containing protein [Planctomycetota bacterium]
MPEIQAFRGIRYNLGHVGSLSDVVAPPYDVISPELQEELYKRHPCNVVRLILNRMEPGDDEVNNRYTRAKRFLRNWQSEGVLFVEADPAIYVYYQEFTHEGRSYTRGGFMARMRIEPFGSGRVFPHEHTMSEPKIDRLMLTALCQANLSPVFGIFPDPEGKARSLLDQAIAGRPPLEAIDHLGIRHRLWPVTDIDLIASLAAAVGPQPVFIADGHHRYETACRYREQVFDSGCLSPEHPANFVLMHFAAMEDPGLLILPSHRLFRGLPPISSEQLIERLGELFTTRPAGQGPEAAPEVWEDMQTAGDQTAMGFYTRADRRWIIAQLTEAGRSKMAEVAADHNPEWHQLGVSVLHRLVIETLLETPQPPKPRFVHWIEDLMADLDDDEFTLAALVLPPTVEHIRSISLVGERLPSKATFFYPKLLSGLVINPLE